MNHPDGELPENWQGKSKDIENTHSIRRLWFAVALLILLLGIGVAVGILRPDLMGALFPNVGQTRTAEALNVQQTQQALQSTAQANEQIGTQAALNLQGTQSALDATQGALNQAGTQSALDAIAARTVTVQAIQQNATMDALALQGTQAAFNLQGTQAGLDVQSTLAILQGSNPTQVIVDPVLATPTPTVSVSASTIDDDFSSGISTGVWLFGIDDWLTSASGGGLIARRANSTLLTQRANFADYTFDVWFVPPTQAGDIYLVHNTAGSTAWAVRFYYNGSMVTETALFSSLETLQSMTAQTISAQIYHARVQVTGTRIQVSLNDQRQIDATIASMLPGAVGVVVPADTMLTRVTITTD